MLTTMLSLWGTTLLTILLVNRGLAWAGPNDPEWVISPKLRMPVSELAETAEFINQQAGGAENVHASNLLDKSIPSFWRAKMDVASKRRLQAYPNVSNEGFSTVSGAHC